MKLTVSHHTCYTYASEVARSTQYIRLTPASTPHQTVYHWELELPVSASLSRDAYGNLMHVMTIDHPHDAISIAAHGMVEISGEDDPDGSTVNPLYFLRDTDLTRPDAVLHDYARGFAGTNLRETLEAMMDDLRQRMPYTPGSTQVHEAASATFGRGMGVCQDHAHVFIACCRSLGVPARYVSGYIHVDDAGHLASHAWVEAWLQERWQTFDVTNGLTRPSHHLKLAVGLDYLEACPVRGIRWGGEQESMSAHAAVSLSEALQ